MFLVTVKIHYVNGSYEITEFQMPALGEADVRRQVSREYVLKHVSDDWPMDFNSVEVMNVTSADGDVPY
jgi:hypothetical protein